MSTGYGPNLFLLHRPIDRYAIDMTHLAQHVTSRDLDLTSDSDIDFVVNMSIFRRLSTGGTRAAKICHYPS